MRYSAILIAVAAVTAANSVTSTASAQVYYPNSRQIDAQVWAEDERDFYRSGDRMNVRFSVSDDAYVAVVHIDPDGYLEFLYPSSPWDNEYVRGGRIHTLPARSSVFTVRGRSGIGYLYIIASPTPLDFSAFRGRSGSPWEWGYAGRSVHGDPFLAFDQVARLVLPRWSFGGYAENYYSYHVGGIHRYPTYACSDRYYSSGWGWYPSYGSCSGLDYFLRDDPYYYDTRRYRGDRRAYLRQYEQIDPLHGFKESPNAPARVAPSNARPQVQSRPGSTSSGGAGSGEVERRQPVPAVGVPRSTARPAERPATSAPRPQSSPAPAERSRPEPSSAAREPAQGRSSGSSGSSGSTGTTGRRPAVN